MSFDSARAPALPSAVVGAAAAMTPSACRFCGAPLTSSFADLGMSPLANAFVRPDRARQMEPFYPLHAYVCDGCRLVQLEQFESPQQLFGDYLYFSSFSDTWLEHARTFVEQSIARFGLDGTCRVVEVASNDGYLLQYFQQKGIPVLGVEPAANVAAVAIDKGIPTQVAFFGQETAARLKAGGAAADLIVANNVLAHVPDVNDFVAGLRTLLAPHGVLSVEFPHLLNLIEQNQFDTIYHEHFSYFSLHVARRVLERHRLSVFDVEELSTHGGSLRVFAGHAGDATRSASPRVQALLARELDAGLEHLEVYRRFSERVQQTRRDVLSFLIAAGDAGKRVVGYGAPAKGNTLLNFCGVRTDMMSFTVDRSPYKQGLLLPGTRIPIRAPQAILAERPDYVFILPWNLKEEIIEQMKAVRTWGGRFVVPIPRIQVL